VLGIRWAPGKRFEDSSTYVRGIDVDDILEEEAEEELLAAEGGPAADAPDDGDDDVDDVAEAVEPPAPRQPLKPEPAKPTPQALKPEPAKKPPTLAFKPRPAFVADAEDDEDEDEDEALGWEPPEDGGSVDEDEAPAATKATKATKAAKAAKASKGAPAGDPAQLQALAQALTAGHQPAVIDARLLEPVPQASALAAGVPLDRVREALQLSPTPGDVAAWPTSLAASDEQMAENVRNLLEWWGGISERPNRRADQFGIMPFGQRGWQEGTRAAFMFKLACLAVSLLREPDAGDVAFAVLDGAGFYDRLFDNPGSAEALLDELFEQGLGSRPELFGGLHLVLMLARSLRGAESWCAELDGLGGEEVLAGLWKRLAAFNLHLETFWIVREMSLFGLLRQEPLRELRVVPTLEVRRAAFHLGLLETSRGETLPELIYASRRLSPLMASEMEGPLFHFWRVYGAHPPARFWSR
jgi:hypothetical protein